MKTNLTLTLLAFSVSITSLTATAEEVVITEPSVSILEVMEKVITPATNTLWGVDNPSSDEDWLPLEEAAVTALVATNITALGGTGEQDSIWVQDPAYQAFNTLMQSSLTASLKAIRDRDLDALIESGDPLYTSCESCHLQFNPGVINSQ